MATFRHMRASWSTELPISAARFVAEASDWVGSMDHLLDNPFKFAKCVYASGSERGKLPCTRLMYIDKTDMSKEQAAALPEHFRETLFAVDHEAHTLVYQVEGDVLGMRNYYATKEAEPLGPDRCRATITARFDLRSEIDPDTFVANLQAVYKAVILGIGKHASGS
jgi:hypothetical protein